VRRLPVGALLWLLVAYLAVIGPLDRFWLKRLRREMLTWITFPLYVAGFSALIYLIGYKLRAGQTEWNEMHVVDVTPIGSGERADLRGRTYFSAYAPANARYQVRGTEAYATLRGEYLRTSYRSGQVASRADIVQVGNSFRGEIIVPVWTSQLYVGDWWRQDAPPVEVHLRGAEGDWEVEVFNRTQKPVTDLRLVIGDQVFNLPQRVPPGKSLKVKTGALRSQDLDALVTRSVSSFQRAIRARQRAFGREGWLDCSLDTVLAVTFLNRWQRVRTAPTYPSGPYGFPVREHFVGPSGFDLSGLLARGYAILLAWQSDTSPIQPMNLYAPRRSQRHTVWRIAVPLPQAP